MMLKGKEDEDEEEEKKKKKKKEKGGSPQKFQYCNHFILQLA